MNETPHARNNCHKIKDCTLTIILFVCLEKYSFELFLVGEAQIEWLILKFVNIKNIKNHCDAINGSKLNPIS